MFLNYSAWFGLWSLVHLLDMFGDTIVHLEGTLFVLLSTPFCMFMCISYFICEGVVLEICGDTIVHFEGTQFVLLCTPYYMIMCISYIVYVEVGCVKFAVTPGFILRANCFFSCLDHFHVYVYIIYCIYVKVWRLKDCTQKCLPQSCLPVGKSEVGIIIITHHQKCLPYYYY